MCAASANPGAGTMSWSDEQSRISLADSHGKSALEARVTTVFPYVKGHLRTLSAAESPRVPWTRHGYDHRAHRRILMNPTLLSDFQERPLDILPSHE